MLLSKSSCVGLVLFWCDCVSSSNSCCSGGSRPNPRWVNAWRERSNVLPLSPVLSLVILLNPEWNILPRLDSASSIEDASSLSPLSGKSVTSGEASSLTELSSASQRNWISFIDCNPFSGRRFEKEPNSASDEVEQNSGDPFACSVSLSEREHSTSCG